MIISLVLDITYQPNYFSMSEPGVGRFLVAFSVQGVVFIFLLFAIELQCVRNLRRLLTSLGRRRKQVAELLDWWTRKCLFVSLWFFSARMQIFQFHQKWNHSWYSVTNGKECSNNFELRLRNNKISADNLLVIVEQMTCDDADLINLQGIEKWRENKTWTLK